VKSLAGTTLQIDALIPVQMDQSSVKAAIARNCDVGQPR
jgi:hypothetical protein